MPIPSTTPFLSTSPSYQFFKFLLSPVSPTFLLLPVYVVILLLVTLTHNFDYYYLTTTIKPLTTQSSTSTYFSSSMSWSTIVLSPQPALQPPQSRTLSMSQTSVSLAERRHQFIIYVANPRLPGSTETPVHHLCRDPPSPIHFSLVFVHPVVKEDRGRKLSSVIEPLLPLLLLIVSRIQDP